MPMPLQRSSEENGTSSATTQTLPLGYATLMASEVRFCSDVLATNAPSHSASSASSPKDARLGHLDVRRGERAGLVQAQHAHAAHRLHRIGALDERLVAGQPHDRQRVGDRDHDHQPLRDQRNQDGRGARALHHRQDAAVVADQHERDRDGRQCDQQAHGTQDPRHIPLERRLVLTERPRTGRQLVGKALGADLRRHVASLPVDTEAARENAVPDVLGDPVRLAGEQRFVGLEAPLGDPAIQQQLIPAPDHHQIAKHRQDRIDGALHAVANDRRGRPREHAQAIEALLGADLLHQPDDDVHEDQHAGHRSVPEEAQDEQHQRDQDEQDVDDREHVLTEDVPVAPTRPDPRIVAQPPRPPGVRLPVREPGRWRRRKIAGQLRHDRLAAGGRRRRGWAALRHPWRGHAS